VKGHPGIQAVAKKSSTNNLHGYKTTVPAAFNAKLSNRYWNTVLNRIKRLIDPIIVEWMHFAWVAGAGKHSRRNAITALLFFLRKKGNRY